MVTRQKTALTFIQLEQQHHKIHKETYTIIVTAFPSFHAHVLIYSTDNKCQHDFDEIYLGSFQGLDPETGKF